MNLHFSEVTDNYKAKKYDISKFFQYGMIWNIYYYHVIIFYTNITANIIYSYFNDYVV